LEDPPSSKSIVVKRFNFTKETNALLEDLCVNVLASSNKSAMIRALIKVEAELQGIRGKSGPSVYMRQSAQLGASSIPVPLTARYNRVNGRSFNKNPKASISVYRATTGRSANVALTPYMQRRGPQSRAKDPFCCAYCGSRAYLKAFATVYGNGSMMARSKRGLILKTGWSQTFRQSIVAEKCSPPKPRRVFWRISVVLLGVGTLAASTMYQLRSEISEVASVVFLFGIFHGLRRHPVEQVEISAPHGAMGKLLSLQPLLKSHHHRTSLRTISQALSPRKGTPLLLTHGERLCFGVVFRLKAVTRRAALAMGE
jgi:hypothetical protein